jgi:HD-GYP domain-containing protein (c-di-GMP phosphodiesterase class II)
VQLKTAISDETKTKALRSVGELIKQVGKTKSLSLDSQEVRAVASDIASEVRKSVSEEPIGLFNTYAVSDPRAMHAVNVSCIVSALAHAAGCSHAAISEYAQAALLHDITLQTLEDDQKDNCEHANISSEMLKKGHTTNPRTYMAVAMHHERYDGKGKPKGHKDISINEGARMIAVGDMYDNIVNGYAGYEKMTYHYAVEFINACAGRELDPKMVAFFNTNIAIYPTGATVLLNNGFKAVVVGQNENFPSRPRVRLLMPNKSDCLLFNMLTHSTLFIESVEI